MDDEKLVWGTAPSAQQKYACADQFWQRTCDERI